jgi:GT2 family glycosyltransferase
MSAPRRRRIVVLGMMTHYPIGGIAWLTMPYVVGLARLGFEVTYLETHAVWPTQLVPEDDPASDGSVQAAAYIERVMGYFGSPARWAFHARHSDGRYYGMSEREVAAALDGAEFILNLHAGTEAHPELAETGRLVCMDTDPVGLQVDVCNGHEERISELEKHCAYFTWGESIGKPGCLVPVPKQFDFRPTRVPILVDLWRMNGVAPGDAYTTIGNWEQVGCEVDFEGETYEWTKHLEFFKFIDLPGFTEEKFELALGRCPKSDAKVLRRHGWSVRDGLGVSRELDDYRRYIHGSKGEFTVAKDQNVRLRSGWFSDRSAAYLAAGRPVITQETGFSEHLPTGEGLFGFSTMADILGALETIAADYEGNSRAAREIAREYFDAPVVLTKLLADLGVALPAKRRGRRPADGAAFPSRLRIEPLSRRPIRLHREVVHSVLTKALPQPATAAPEAGEPEASIVVTTLNNVVFTRLCLESVLANTEAPAYELIVVDNGSQDGTVDYLRELARRFPHVRVIENARNEGFAAAANRGLEAARGDKLVLLNNDTIVPQGWLWRLTRQLDDPSVGLVGPVTNRIGTEAEIQTGYTTYGGMLEVALGRQASHHDVTFEVPMLAMFCIAMRRKVFAELGPLDTRFGPGLFEDDDYSVRATRAGYRLVCVSDAFVHHFGEATFGRLFAASERELLFRRNRDLFERKWSESWQPHGRTPDAWYRRQTEDVRKLVDDAVPAGTTVLVVSKGDPRLADLGEREVWHFPSDGDGGYAGYYPRDSEAAIDELEALRAKGAEYLVVPGSAEWWMEYYEEFFQHLAARYEELADGDGACRIYALSGDREPVEVEA